MYSAAAAFRSRSTRPSQTLDDRGQLETPSHEARGTGGEESSRLNFLAEASSSQPWVTSQQQWGGPATTQTPQSHRENIEGPATGVSTAPSNITPTDPM